ncbi:MAG: sigma-70 family RNA polymerase sigma factor [Prevotella sp.]|nr:sigma-70 family RNA polymerase sigma factor [Prevotella sp.]
MVERLIERIRNHDQRAMSELYQRYIGMLSSVCYRYVPSEPDAKDVLQNSFVKIFTSIPSFDYRGDEAFEGWMVKIVVNEALNFLRDRKKLQFAAQEAAQEQVVEDEEPDAGLISPDELHRLIQQLPDGYRTVLNLYVFEGHSHKQIAAMLGISQSTSGSQLYFAKQWLAKKINAMKE